MPMYVVNNELGINGAITILYDNLMKNFANNVGDFYIIPSSVHEMLFIPCCGGLEADSIKDMVYNVNRESVREEDFLSDNIYHYDMATNTFKIV